MQANESPTEQPYSISWYANGEAENFYADNGVYYVINNNAGWNTMQGLVFNEPVSKYINSALENGMLIINAGNDIIRFLPPLIVEKRDIDEMICILRKSIEAI